MTYTIYFTFEKGKKAQSEINIKTREDCLSVIDNMGKHTNYASFCLITDGNGKHIVENIIYENRKLKSIEGYILYFKNKGSEEHDFI